MPIKRSTADATFSAQINVILTGSKNMTREEQDRLITVNRVHILIADADDPDNVLVDEDTDATEFSTGSVGYKLTVRGAQFTDQTPPDD